MTETKKRIVGFDIIRLMACLFVCIVHFNASICGWSNGVFLNPNSIVPNFLLGNRVYLGTLGVSLFFIISGASLMLSTKPSGNTMDFYRKRILNIYPQFWIAFEVATLFDFFMRKGMNYGNARNLLISFAGMDGYLSVLSLIPWEFYKVGEWFLGCIILIYLVFPWMLRFLDRYPAAACGCFGLLYLFSLYAIAKGVPILGGSYGITNCACQMFFGMAYIRFGLHQKKKTLYGAIALFLVAWLLRDLLPGDLLTFALAFLLLEVVMILSENIKSESLKNKLAYGGALTYPIFLVHHFLSDRMVQGFDLANMSRLYIYVMFASFVAGTLLLAMGLKKIGDSFAGWIRKHKTVMAAIMVILLLSYGYTAFRVVHHQIEQKTEKIAMQVQLDCNDD